MEYHKAREKRIWRDSNGLYHIQIRFVPIYEWEDNDGWRSIYITDSEKNATEKLYGEQIYEGYKNKS